MPRPPTPPPPPNGMSGSETGTASVLQCLVIHYLEWLVALGSHLGTLSWLKDQVSSFKASTPSSLSLTSNN